MEQNNKSIVLPTASKRGYDFEGWTTSSGEELSTSNIYDNITLTAKYSPLTLELGSRSADTSQAWSTSTSLHYNVDLTNYSKVYFYGVSSICADAGGSAAETHCVIMKNGSIAKYSNVFAMYNSGKYWTINNATYVIDVSGLTGTYDIGVYGGLGTGAGRAYISTSKITLSVN